MEVRKIPCPLCNVETRSKDLKHGICVTCADARKYSVRENWDVGSALSQKLIEQNLTAAKNYAKASKEIKQKKEFEEKKKEITEEQKRVNEIHKEQASLALARRSLLHYVERYKPGYDPSWAHEDVARRIQNFVEKVERKESPRLILQICSRFGKSLLASEAAPAWILGQHSDWSIVIASYSDELPVQFSKNIRAQLRSPEFRQVFPNGAKLSPDDAGAKAWSTVSGGSIRATGVGGGLIGFGADILIIDDPIKDMTEADSPGALEKVYDWFSSVAYSRLLPGGGVLVIQQRMAHEDLVGRLETRMYEEEEHIKELRDDAAKLMTKKMTPSLAAEIQLLEDEADELDVSMDRWDIATYSALATHDEYLTDLGEIVRIQPTMNPEPSWKLLRKRGEAIHPKRYNRNYYLKLKRANPRRFAAMYMLTPQVDDGEFFNKNSFKRYKPNHHPVIEQCFTFAAWDLAIGTKQSNDHTVGIAGLYDPDGALWLLERIRGKFGDVRQIADMVIDLHTRWNCSQTGIERTHIEMAMGPILKTRMREREMYINLAEGKEALKPINDKKVRARPLQNLCQAGKVYVPEGEDWDEYISLMTRFGATTIDDDVDATAWLAILCTRHSPPRSPAEKRKAQHKEPKSWYDELMEEMRRDDLDYMSA